MAGLLTPDLVLWLQTWAEIRADVTVNWWIYLSMPLIAALIGYTTKIVALEMLYRPLEFKGVGVFGWQGLVPRRAGKVAAVTIEMLTENLLKPEEILDRIDPQQAVEELREPLTRIVDELAREISEQYRPGLWDSLPDAGRRALQARVHAAAPQVVDNLLAEMRSDLNRYLDIQYLAVTLLVRNKEQLNDLMRGVAGDAMAFVRRSGIYFGLAIGLVQMVAWAWIHNPWIMPVFGFVTGFVSDWLALNMLFRPQHEKRYLGFIPFQGILHARRQAITRDYARIMAQDIFAPDVIMDALLNGPSSDQLFAAVEREVSRAIDAQTGIATPLVRLAVGTERYRALKSSIVALMIERMPDTLGEAQEYTARTLDIENTIVDKMSQLSNEQFEAIMRPIFKDDEMLMVMVGALLGFGVGELQVLMVKYLSRDPGAA